MKISEAWLREWVNPKLSTVALCDQLTMSGFEIEEISPVAGEFTGVVVGKVLKVDKHPNAEKLKVCEVSIDSKKILNIVCGADNVVATMLVPVAIVGAKLPDNKSINATEIRGVKSQGMLCSAVELGLSEDSQGLLVLPSDAPIGEDFRKYYLLDDATLDIAITPNRGDCLSAKGVAREIAAITGTRMTSPLSLRGAKRRSNPDQLNVSIKAITGCPRYIGQIIRHVNSQAETPIWIKERLRRSGTRSINAIVDVTNYVMLELGQPMHAFDLAKIDKQIIVRNATKAEKLLLLDGSEKQLDTDTMVIADQQKPLAIAGVMGGMESGVTTLTNDIFLESAYFSPATIARARQKYQLNSDSAYRFERGIDPTIQAEAIERATQLILEIAGGEAGKITEVTNKKHLPKANATSLSHDKITELLGVSIPEKKVTAIFKSLGFKCTHKKSGWQVMVPAYRSDILIPEDLVEEVARLYGYNKIPIARIQGALWVQPPEDDGDLSQLLRQSLNGLGYHEVITYSFVDNQLQSLLNATDKPKPIMNPITADMDVMRTNLWPGLINTLLYNKSRQQHLVRIFEIGSCFIAAEKGPLKQPTKLAGLISGFVYPEQWGIKTRSVDFFDLKGDVASLEKFAFTPASHPALHPGQTADIRLSDQKIGIIGKLHPSLCQKLDLSSDVYLFELDVSTLKQSNRTHYQEVSKFPEIRRDIAIIVRDTVPAIDIQDTISRSAGHWLKDVFIFDVYQGKGIEPGSKSVALALILQNPARTLVDEEVAELMQRVVTALKGQFGAELRS